MSSFAEKFSDIISDTYNYFSHSLWRQPIVAPAGPVLLLWLVVFALSGIFEAGPRGGLIIVFVLWTTWGFHRLSEHIQELRDEIKKLSPERLEEMDKNQFF